MKRALLIATRNPSKKLMFRRLLGDLPLDLCFLDQLNGVPPAPLENGATVEENALIKARYYAQWSGCATLGDDAGFAIAALGGAPGVQARRWGGVLSDDVSDEAWLVHYLAQLNDLPGERFEATIPFARCLYLSETERFFQSDSFPLFVTRDIRRPYHPGWPISSVAFYPDGRRVLDVSQDDPARLKQLRVDVLRGLVERIC